ncbi:glycosyl hydrolase [Limibacter armeniacum]|uniref:glycosyl hydrolase n=1 Tax=Limibacter armeniacum TaxID=466084 RepID=UPI002FE6186C
MNTIRSLIVLALLCLHFGVQAQTPFESLNYLYSIQGSKTIGGMHNRQPNSNPNQYSQQLNGVLGQWPGLYSADFQFEYNEVNARQTMINQVITEWNNGAMINLMWHACNPVNGEPCNWDGSGVLGSLTNSQWNELITNGTALNNKWKSMMDEIAYYLQQLEDAGVEVFFRPLHEMNQGMFWWGGRPGPNGTAKLYQITHDYFTNTKGLSNLIWVWNMQDYSGLANDLYNYDPGWNYWDVLTLDMYWSDGQGYTTQKYNAMVAKAGGRPIGIGECEDLPAVSLLNNQPLWTFFMGWSELTFSGNSTQKIQDIYWSSRVLTLNEMPGWTGSGSWQNPTTPTTQYIQAEDYSNMSGVQTETTSDSGGGNLNVGWIDSGDWMSYSNINVPSTGSYTIAYRVASPSGGTIQLEQAGGAAYGTINVPNTGGYQSWTTIYQTVNLNAGVQGFGIKALTGGWNFNWWSITPNSGARLGVTALEGLNEEKLNAYPNPFTAKVKIPVGESPFNLNIYDMSGKIVRSFTKADPANPKEVVWDGSNITGTAVAPGLYHYRLYTEGKVLSGKIMKDK